jgi:hypothetical protein
MTDIIYFSRDYYHQQNNNEKTFSGVINEKLGVYRAEYNIVNGEPINCCGLFVTWKDIGSKEDITFYKNDNIIFTKKYTKVNSCMILYGDGETDENTFFLVNENNDLKIYNMKNEFIKSVILGPDTILCIKKINHKYAISIYEMRTGDRFTGLINLDILFVNNNNNTEEEKINPYDNSRIHIPICDEQLENDINYMPVACNSDGFIIKNVNKKELIPNIISFDDVYNYVFDFYEENVYDKQMEDITNTLNKHNINITKEQLSNYLDENNNDTISIKLY